MIPFPHLFAKLLGNTATADHALFTSPGTFQWTVPEGVYTVAVLVVGGGGNGSDNLYWGGGGGGLAWKNNIAVTPGQVVNVVVGGKSGTSSVLGVSATGGQSGPRGSPGDLAVGGEPFGHDGGGAGGAGQYGDGSAYGSGGAGGAGGYTGNGGRGGIQGSGATRGTGGGGGGNDRGAGGGVGVYGEGPSGVVGQPGSGGQGVRFGGGESGTSGPGTGAVRILWGQGEKNGGRAFPATKVDTAEGHGGNATALYASLDSSFNPVGPESNIPALYDGSLVSAGNPVYTAVRIRFPEGPRYVLNYQIATSNQEQYTYRIRSGGVWSSWSTAVTLNAGVMYTQPIGLKVDAIDVRRSDQQTFMLGEFAPVYK